MTSLTPDLSTPSPISTLERLEVLDLHGVPLTEIPNDLGHKKSRIYYLDFSCPTIKSLPFNIFSDMENLHFLKLINNSLLEELPKSLCEAQNLEEIELNGCRSLIAIDSFPIKKLKVIKIIGNDHIVQLPESLSRSHNLQELTISDCQSLTEIKIIGHASLKSFSLSYAPTSSLSLRGCRELEPVVLHDLDKLEELDLSGTAIKEFPVGIPGSRQLRKVDFGAASHLKRVPWHQLDHVPEEFNLDQCEHFTTTIGDSDSQIKINPNAGVCISVRDSRLFNKLDEENCRRLVAGGSLQSFYILVSSCEKRKEKMRRPSRSIQPQTGATCIYKDADYFKNLIPMPPPAQHPLWLKSILRNSLCLVHHIM